MNVMLSKYKMAKLITKLFIEYNMHVLVPKKMQQ